jgi:hypothetical protein
MGNKKVLSKATRELNKTKRFATPKNIIEDPRGQWAHPGEITRIPSDKITMQGVPYPVMAYPNMGEPQMMYPGGEYTFPGADYVDEYPELKKGGTPKSLVKMPKPSKKGLASKKFSRSLEATNRLFTENPLFSKPKSKKRKVFDPNAQYQDGGVISQEEVDAANNAMMKARLAYAQMHGNPAAQRMVVAPDQPYDFGDGNTGTHYMASMDEYAVPQIQDVDGQLMLGDYGPESAEAMRFDNPEDAMYFAENYKEVSPAFELELSDEEIEEYRKGGFIVEDISVPSLNQMQMGGDAACPPGHVKIGGKCVPAGNQPTFQDSLDVYNMQMRQNAYYNKHKKFFNNTTIHKSPIAIEVYTDDLSSGKTRRESIDALRNDYNLQKNRYSFYATNNKAPFHMRGEEKEKWEKSIKKNIAESKKKMQQIRSAIEEHYPSRNNKHYYKDLITGAIDPNAPTSYYHDQIKPQGLIERDANMKLRTPFDGIDVTTVYYDPLAIKPAKLLSDAEIKKRYEKYGESGIPESRLKRLNLTEKKPTVQQQTTTKKPTVQQYPKEYKPVVNNIPPGISKSQLEKAGVIIGDKAIVGYEEVQQLDPTTGKVTTIINPVYSDIEKPIPTLHPTRVNPTITGELRKFVGEEEPGTGTDVMPVYDTDELPEYATPDPDAEWVGDTERYIDWDGNRIPYRLPRFRKPGHGGDLIKKGKRRYLNLPSIETRNSAYIQREGEEEYQEGGSPDPKTNFYTVEGSGGVYRKVNGKWEVDWNRSGKFQPLSKGDVAKRTAVLNSQAKPLYDATYDDLYATQRSAFTAAPKPTATKKPTAQDKAAQEKFDKTFAVTGKSKMEVVEDKIQKGIDEYVKYHNEKYDEPLTQEEYDAAYQDIYNRAYINDGVYKPTMSGPVANPYGTTELRKNLISLDPGEAPKNLTLGDYVDKGWDIVTNPLDYASYALKPKGTVTTPWNMTNYENRLEAAGLEDPVTANNNVNKAIDFASWFIGPGMVAQGLKMVPGTVNSIGRAFENPSWENTGNAVWDAGMTALSIAPGFGIAKNLGKPASTIDDLKAIEALRGNTTTTPFQSYYLTGDRALGATEAGTQQSEALRKFIEPQSPQLAAGRSPIMSEGTRTQLTNPAVDSYFPVRFGDDPYAAAGNEFYRIDPEDYNVLNEATQKLETDPNWRQEGLKDAYSSLNSPSNKSRGTGPDFFKGIDYEFKDFSPGWQAARDAKDLIMPAQRMPKKSDYFSDSEFYDMLSQEMNYNILDDERKIQEFRAGKKFTDEEFAQMNPGVTRPDFTTKMLTDEHRKVVNELLSDNPSVKSNPLLKENLEAAVARSERRENALPISVTIRQDLEKYPSETLINLYGDQYAGVSPEQIASLSPEQLEQTKQTIIDNIANAMTKSEEEFARENPFRSGDTSMSLNRTTDILPKGKSNSKDPLNKLAGLVRRRKSKSELSALDDLETIRKQSRTGQENAANLLNNEIEQKLKDLDTPEGRRRVQKYIKDNNLSIEEYDPGNYDELTKTIDSELPGILSNKYSDESRRIVDLVRNNMIAKKRSPQLMANIKSWNELEPEHILKSPLLNRIAVTDIIVPADPRFTGGIKQRPFTYDEYIESVQNVVYEDIAVQIQEQQALIKRVEDNIRKLAVEKNIVNGGFGSAKIPNRGEVQKIMADYNRKILDEHTKIAMINKNISSLTDRLQRNNASFDKDMFYNNELTNVISLGDPFTAMGDVLPTMTHEIGHHTETIGLGRGKNSAIDRDLIANLDFAKKAPQYLYKKLDPDKVRETAPYHTNFEGIDKYRDPKDYFKRNLDYFKKGNTGEVGKSSEPSAFVVEMRPALKELGFIEGNFDIVTPEMIEQLYNEYITNPTFEFRDLRIFDIIEPSKKSFKQLAKSYNDIKSLLPYAVPVGIGVGATSVGGQEEMQQDMEYQNGGIVMELSDAEIKEYKKGGWIVEEM